jgi:serine-type D-Ala-D-Ala carboxypeptidase (penicillin-binding protein 5/6)
MTHLIDAPAPLFGRSTLHAPQHRRRRRTSVLVAVVAVIAAAAASLAVYRYVTADSRHEYLGRDGWPTHGQAAYAIGDGALQVSPGAARPAPIASLAKLMTAHLVLAARPLAPGADGFTLTVTAADVADTDARRRHEQSVVRVAAGERLTERQALLALMLPSANNVAVMLARAVAGSTPAFVARMNAEARRLHMTGTTYTDPSGFDERTVSTALDQTRLARALVGDATLAALAATRSARLPVAGVVHNTDRLLGSDGFEGTKTGSDDAAGGCFVFRAQRIVNGRIVTLVGAVLGQPGRNLIDAGQYAARQLVARVA